MTKVYHAIHDEDAEKVAFTIWEHPVTTFYKLVEEEVPVFLEELGPKNGDAR